MSGSIDDVVEPSHHVEVAIIVEVAGISRSVVARGFLQIFFNKSLIIVVESQHERWRHG